MGSMFSGRFLKGPFTQMCIKIERCRNKRSRVAKIVAGEEHTSDLLVNGSPDAPNTVFGKIEIIIVFGGFFIRFSSDLLQNPYWIHFNNPLPTVAPMGATQLGVDISSCSDGVASKVWYLNSSTFRDLFIFGVFMHVL